MQEKQKIGLLQQQQQQQHQLHLLVFDKQKKKVSMCKFEEERGVEGEKRERETKTMFIYRDF